MLIIDVKDWEKQVYGIGTRKKYLYIDPQTRRRAFFKYPMIDMKTGKRAEGEVWSEKVAADIGKIINIRTPDVEIAKNEDGYGSLSFNFLNTDEQLHHGAEFLDALIYKFDPKNLYHHRLEVILYIVNGVNLLSDFMEILIFDALIGNTDRHSENWGLISNIKDETYKLAPAYDNSSSLAREFYFDEERCLLLKDENRFNRYVFGKHAAACISTEGKKRTPHFELIENLLMINKRLVRNKLEKIYFLDDSQIDRVLSGLPDNIMSDISKELVKKILIARRDKLIEIRG